MKLAGERREVVSSKLEDSILDGLDKAALGNFFVNGCAELWVLIQLVHLRDPHQQYTILPKVEMFCSRVIIMRVIIHLIRLRQGLSRLIDLDVEEYTQKIKNK